MGHLMQLLRTLNVLQNLRKQKLLSKNFRRSMKHSLEILRGQPPESYTLPSLQPEPLHQRHEPLLPAQTVKYRIRREIR